MPSLKSAAVLADVEDMDISAIALQGLQQAEIRLENATTRIASYGADTPDATALDVVDLAAGMVGLTSARNQVSLNLKILSTANEIQRNMINVMA